MEPNDEDWFGIEHDPQMRNPETRREREKYLDRLWRMYTGQNRCVFRSQPFRYSDEALLAIAKKRPPQSARCKVSSFSSWIMSLYVPKTDDDALEAGHDGERQVGIEMLASPPASRSWRLAFQDKFDGLKGFQISSLTVNSTPMRGLPDLVFKHDQTGRILIVERKCSDKDIPRGGWPNLKAQLWCYSQIDKWKHSAGITLVGEVWAVTRQRIWRRAIYSWTPQQLEPMASALFEAYGGQFNPSV